MVLKFDIKSMSYNGYSIEKFSKIHQSHGYCFGKPTIFEGEVIICDRCSKECPTANNIETGKALWGKCPECDMEYFTKNKYY